MAERTIDGRIAVAMTAIGQALDAREKADANRAEGQKALAKVHLLKAANCCELASDIFEEAADALNQGSEDGEQSPAAATER